MRWSLRVTAAVVAVVAVAPPAPALVMRVHSPLQRAATADVVVVGKVTAVEKDPVEVKPFPDSPETVALRVAVVKVHTPIAGAANLTHVRVGFLPRPANPQPGPRSRGPMTPELKEGDEFLFFLVPHPAGGLYAMPHLSPPLPVEGDEGRKNVETARRVAATLADPTKGLTSDRPDNRYFTAAVLITRYRAYPEFAGGQVDQVPIPLGESRLILKSLLDKDWVKLDPAVPNPTQLFFSLQLTDADGWTPPKPQQGAVYNAQLKEEFTKWLDGPGKEYQIKRFVTKRR
jgi:hypothetical protein